MPNLTEKEKCYRKCNKCDGIISMVGSIGLSMINMVIKYA
jgi:hypothetical protein